MRRLKFSHIALVLLGPHLFLLSGSYRVAVSREGFRTAVRNDVAVAIGSIVRLDLNLEVGEVRETISVEATAELLKLIFSLTSPPQLTYTCYTSIRVINLVNS